MQKTTTAFGAAVYADARFSDMRVVFKLVDVTAAGDCEPSATNEAYLSNLGQTHDDVKHMGMKLATLEMDSWALDESVELPKEDMSGIETGWWSGVLSGEDGTFPAPPSLCFDFAKEHSSVGFTLYFDDAAGEWPEDFDILTFDAKGQRVSIDKVRGNAGAVYVSNVDAAYYRRVEIVFRKTAKPYRRVRVVEVVFGVVQTFDRDNTAEMRTLYQIDPSMDTLPMGEMTITIDNRSRMYNIVNPNGAYRYLQGGQPMDSELGVGDNRDSVERVNMGRYYYHASSAKDGGMTAEITARDALARLDRGIYRKGADAADTVWNVVDDIISDSGTALEVNIPAEIGNVMVGRAIPVCSHREALRYVAQAACAVCFMGRDDRLWFVKLREDESADTLDADNMEEYPDIETGSRVNTIEVSAYSFKDRKENAEQEKLYDGTAALSGETELWATYSAPARNAAATVTGGTLVRAEYYLYAARLILSGNGEAGVSISGVALDKNESVYTLRDVGAHENERIGQVENPLVYDTAGAQRLAAWRMAVERRTLVYPVRERGNPAREVGDTVTVHNAYGERRPALVVKQEFSYDGGLSADTSLAGGGA